MMGFTIASGRPRCDQAKYLSRTLVHLMGEITEVRANDRQEQNEKEQECKVPRTHRNFASSTSSL